MIELNHNNEYGTVVCLSSRVHSAFFKFQTKINCKNRRWLERRHQYTLVAAQQWRHEWIIEHFISHQLFSQYCRRLPFVFETTFPAPLTYHKAMNSSFVNWCDDKNEAQQWIRNLFLFACVCLPVLRAKLQRANAWKPCPHAHKTHFIRKQHFKYFNDTDPRTHAMQAINILVFNCTMAFLIVTFFCWRFLKFRFYRWLR